MQGGAEYIGWTQDRHMSATIIDILNGLTFAFVSANSKKKPKAPKPVWRPGDKERKRKEKQNNPFGMMVKKQMDALRKQDDGKKTIIIDEREAR